MEIRLIKNPINRKELVKRASEGFGDLVKAAVDIKKEMMAVGGELHSDEEIFLTDTEGSQRKNIWGINIYPKKPERERIEFDSMINLKPHSGNRSRDVESKEIKQKIKGIIRKLIIE